MTTGLGERAERVWYVLIDGVLTEVQRDPGAAIPFTFFFNNDQAMALALLLKATADKALELGSAKEARDREEMLEMLVQLEWPEARGRESCHFCKSDKDEGHAAGCEVESLLKRLGRLP